MDDDGIFALTAQERRRAAAMFDGLSDSQWAVQSLCSRWTVRDLAGHLIGPFCVSLPRFVLGGLLAGGFHRYSVRMSRELGRRPTAELVAILRDHADDRFAPPGTGPVAQLTDLAVHTRDAARPLRLDTCAPATVWREVLAFLVSARATRGFVRSGRIGGLRLRATDQDWAHGTGPEVAGPSEALALAITGRDAALADLAGDGLPLLRSRPH